MGALETLAAALHAACLRDLPEIEEELADASAERSYLDSLSLEDRRGYYARKDAARTEGRLNAFYALHNIAVFKRASRPLPEGCSVTLFRQAWATTALGYGGIGGQAFTNAYTVIVECETTGYAAVYFGGPRLAYLVPPGVEEVAYRHYHATRFFPGVAEARLHGWYPFLLRDSERDARPA